MGPLVSFDQSLVAIIITAIPIVTLELTVPGLDYVTVICNYVIHVITLGPSIITCSDNDIVSSRQFYL